MSLVCDAFHCLPSEAVEELENDIGGSVMRIITMRAFARAKEMYEGAKSAKDLPDNPMIDLVQEIEFDIVKRELGRD